MKRAWGARIAIGLGLASLVLIAIGLLFVPRPVEVDSALVSQGPISETVSDQGVAKVREAYLVSSPVSGRLERLDLHVGDRVVADRTLVARIYPASADPLDPRARAQAHAVLAAARAAQSASIAQRDQMAAEHQRTEANLRRIRTLSALAQDRTARAALMAAEALIKVRHSEAAAAQAALIGPDSRLGPFSISVTAPATGRVTRVLQESARYVPAGTALIEVSDQVGLEAAVEFLSQDAVRVSEGMAAQVYDWGGAAPIAAVVRRVEPQGFTKVSALGVEEQRVLVMLQLTGDPRSWSSLGPGYRLWGRVFLRRQDRVTTVPVGALVRIGGRWAVFTIRQGRSYRTFLDIGILTDQKAEVKAGLRPGDRVVLYPSDRVVDQGWVRLRG
jgi:HlyD family secretion protein